MKKNILIVGGGTSGWMSAALLKKNWPDAKVCLVESPNIATVGVGEGSTPYIQTLFEQLGIAEKDWMPFCNATFKNGIRFHNWSSHNQYQSYFHPFLSELDQVPSKIFANHTRLKRQGVDLDVHPDNYFITPALSRQRKRAVLPDGKNAPQTLYAYHFDAAKLAQLLTKKAVELGVEHKRDTISAVNQNTDGSLSSLDTQSGETLVADLFVDCTGFTALLIDKTLNVPFISYANNLFNDSAVAIASEPQPAYLPQTDSIALTAGWAWRIPLLNRTGNGYVYSSRYLDSSAAEQELRNMINSPNGESAAARHLNMRVGRSSQHWYKNCLAIGLSQGFIEPLEATALNFVQDTLMSFIRINEQTADKDSARQLFNDKINTAFERVRDYIVCHYRCNSRQDSDYWLDAQKIPVSDELEAILQCWQEGGDLSALLENKQLTGYYPSASWHSLLAGYGCFPAAKMPAAEKDNRQIKQILAKRAQIIDYFLPV
ncbi:tryptophan halogenase family protein [Gayadomonas joobiniege]|uniref:tryptophan halogenase family protein n=1 Tax=Gayadomonas joobiniege TaxID=1234606 RepID=UPI000370183F|nr:tryptophan halogenase family protein [Gayadomonas joobiniege]